MVEKNSLSELPRLFCKSGTDYVDHDFLEKIFKVEPAPSKKIKILFRKIDNEVRNRQEDMLILLAGKLTSGRFRRKWYDLFEDNSYGGAITPFYSLVMKYVIQNNKELDIDSDSLSEVFEIQKVRKQKKYYPKKDALGLLVDKAIDAGRVGILFLWSLIENTEYAIVRGDKDKRLLDFKNNLMLALNERKYDEAINLLGVIQWGNESAEVVEKNISSTLPNDIDKKVESQFLVKNTNPLHDEFDKTKVVLNEVNIKLKNNIQSLSTKSNSLLNSTAYDSVIEQLNNQVKLLQEDFIKIENAMNLLEENVFAFVNPKLKKIGFNLNVEVPRFRTINNITDLLKDLTKFENESKVAFSNLEKISESYLIEEIYEDRIEKTVSSLHELDSICENSLNKIHILDNGIVSLKELTSDLKKNSSNISWNPLAKDFSNDKLLNVFLYKKIKNEIDDLLGITSAKLGSKVSDELSNILECVIDKEDLKSISDALRLINYLPLQVSEDIFKKNNSLKQIIALAYIHLSLQSKVSLSNKHFLVNSKLLLEFKNNTANSLSNFLDEIYKLINTTAFKNGYSFIIRNMNALSEHEESLNLKDKYNKDLKRILTFYKKGGVTTYAHIWSEAYKDLFEPLYKLVEENDLDGFVSRFYEMSVGLDLDSKLSTWKVNIPEHLKKNSEYNKNVKTSVKSKIDEISNYIDENNAFKAVEKKENLSILIKSVLEDDSPEAKLFQIWLKNLIHFEGLKTDYSILRGLGDDFFELRPEQVPAYYVRTFIKAVKEQQISNDDLLLDALDNVIENHTPTSIANKYREHEMLEGYTKLIGEIENEGISLEVERAIEKEIEDKNDCYNLMIADIEEKINTISLEEKDYYLNELNSLESMIQQQKWYHADLAAIELFNLIEETKRYEVEAFEIEKLQKRISILSGVDTTVKVLRKLKVEHERIMAGMSERLLHISQLEKLKLDDLKGTRLYKVINESIDYFYDSIPYPVETQSQMTAFVWQQAIDPLILELSRSKTLLPSYSTKLKFLTETFILNLSKSDTLEEKSKFNEMMFSISDIWASLPSFGERGIDNIYSAFIENSYEIVINNNAQEERNRDENNNKISVNEIIVLKDTEKEKEKIGRQRQSLIQLIFLSNKNVKNKLNDKTALKLLNEGKWSDLLSSHPEYIGDEEYKIVESDLQLFTWGYSSLMEGSNLLETNQKAYLCYLINKEKSLYDNVKIKTICSNVIHTFFTSICREIESEIASKNIDIDNISDAINYLSTNIKYANKYEDEFRLSFNGVNAFQSYTLRFLWDSFSGDSKQAELRASFMYICWNLNATEILSKCLSFSPIDLDARKANALAEIACKSRIERDNELLQPLYDLKNTLTSKPYAIFVDLLRKVAPVYDEDAALLKLIGPLEELESNNLLGRLCITPRKNDAPDSLVITLPPNGPVRFEGNHLKKQLEGPFLVERIVPIKFILLTENLENFNIEIDIESISITGVKTTYSTKLNIEIASYKNFIDISHEDIENSFDNFPEQQMRGEEYVPRIGDERKIEKALITSKSLRSIWMTSPRRSGKTTMLYRILDGYSHKVGRDVIVVYFTLDEQFSSTTDFNKWLWKRLRAIKANNELRSNYYNFDDIGKALDFENDVGTFISDLSESLIVNFNKENPVTRVIYMFDEVDKFASMYFNGGVYRNTANSILWQIRSMISNSRNVGVVFAGSTAAREIFITNPESPFYNSIEHIELTPFSCKTKESEFVSRQIVEPLKLRGKFELSKQTLEHLLWVCAGIPYYMKLLAGATYSTIRQGKVIESDVNDGLYALLDKRTGIAKLDGMGGAPGTDDLRTTLTVKNSNDGIIAKAVLYTLAELYSPVSGHAVLRGKLTANDCKLTYEYRLTKKQINDGISTCIKLGLICLENKGNTSKLTFAIPILGESIRFNSHKFWSDIHTELKELTDHAGE